MVIALTKHCLYPQLSRNILSTYLQSNVFVMIIFYKIQKMLLKNDYICYRKVPTPPATGIYYLLHNLLHLYFSKKVKGIQEIQVITEIQRSIE